MLIDVPLDEFEIVAKAFEDFAKSIREVKEIAAAGKLERVKCHWLTLSNRYVSQIDAFISDMKKRAEGQVRSKNRGVPSKEDQEMDKARKDPRTRAGRALQEQIKLAVEAELRRRDESKGKSKRKKGL